MKILIVEDDAPLRESLLDFLAADGFDVLGATDGEEGVRIAIKELPDLILLDIILPKKDGYEVIKEVKENKKANKIPIVLLTNLGSLGDIEKALDLGATTYLVKGDYKLREITEKIRSILKT